MVPWHTVLCYITHGTKKKKKKVNCSLFYCEALCKGLQLDMYNVMLLANEVKHIFGLVARDAQGQVCA